MVNKQKKIFESISKCPHCGEKLVFTNSERITCKIHGDWRVGKNIISFSNDETFDKHWSKNYYEQIPQKKIEAAEMFLSPLSEELAGERALQILDAGCGDGIHAYVCKNKINEDSLYIGLDVSLAAVSIASDRVSDEKFVFVHSDISQLPFQPDSFDVVFSYGVLAYTDSARESFHVLCKSLNVGGKIGVWIYPKRSGIGGFAFNAIRNLCRMTGKIGTEIIAAAIVPFLGFLPTSSKINLKNSSWKQCKEVVLVNIAPELLYFPTVEEVRDWFQNENITITNIDQSEPITIWGVKE